MEQFVIGGGTLITPGATVDAPWQSQPEGWISISAGKFTGIGEGRPPRAARTIDARGLTVCPGLIDLHVHGGGGADPLTGRTTDVERMVAFHVSHGTTGLLITTGAMPVADLARALRAAAAVAATPAGAAILGANLEGPLLALRQKGAQLAEHIRAVEPAEFDALLAVAPGFVRLVTTAPEAVGALAAVAHLAGRGVVVSIGHSDATFAETNAAIAAGARHATHTFNAMRGLHHREPGALGAVLLAEDVTAELIMDGLHVHPAAARILLRLKGDTGICLITDAIAAAGLPDGPGSLFGQPLTIHDGAARLADGTLAGSTLTLDRAIGNLVSLAGVDLASAVRMATHNPATVIGLGARKGRLVPGGDADLTLLDADCRARLTIIGGQIHYNEME